MTVQITFTFPTTEAAAAFLAGKSAAPTPTASAPVSAPAASPAPATTASTGFSFDAPSQPSATAAPAAAPALDFDRDVVPALKDAASKLNQQQFGAVMARIKASKVTDIKAMPGTWAPLLAFCETPSQDTFNAIPAAA